MFTLIFDIETASPFEEPPENTNDSQYLPDWKAYDFVGIDNESVWYDDYDFPDAYLSKIDGPAVQGKHISERYVDNVKAGIEATSVHRELTRLFATTVRAMSSI